MRGETGRTWLHAVFVTLTLFLAGCASAARKYDGAAHAAGLSEKLFTGSRFHHKIYGNAVPPGPAPLHVFIEGDASVKQALRHHPPDPTPQRALMMRLMRRDPDAAILLGRPCYHGMFETDACEIRHLAGERYSAEITDSMIEALRTEMKIMGAARAVLFGYSGGGTIAMLMAARMPEITAVVTLAANLDNRALSAYHHAPALTGSLDPARLPPPPPSLTQLHFYGARDENIPASLARETLTRQGASPIIIQNIDHECCWEEYWPEILSRLHQSGAGY